METFTNPKTREKLELAPKDLVGKMTLQQAKDACRELGNGWRLPTIPELEIIFTDFHKNDKGGFKKKDCYWSGSISPDDWVLAFDFSDGRSYINVENFLNRVRVVRPV